MEAEVGTLKAKTHDIKLEHLVSEIIESLDEDQLKLLAENYLLIKYGDLNSSELMAEYIRFNGIESNAELLERLGKY